jgi:hypothetical protein
MASTDLASMLCDSALMAIRSRPISGSNSNIHGGRHARQKYQNQIHPLMDRSRRQSGHLGCRRAGFKLAIIQSQSNELLKAGIDLLMHRGILRSNRADRLEKSRTAVVVIPFRSLESLSVVCRSVRRLRRIPLRGGGTASLNRLTTDSSSPGNFSLAHGILLLGALAASGGCLRGTGLFRRSEVVNPLHMIEKVPSAGKSISWDRPVTSFKNAEMGIVSVTVKSVSFPFVAEKAGIGRKVQFLGHAGRDLAPVRFQVGIQVFAFGILAADHNG